ncbi:hypothetical protein MNBD_IGNAVI01-1762 [hydrothermal vent metagenome]|uniref:3-keto-alpha-glucoside-1,2-lyase/3-keto-2-hydroxy-glucal hydratase domain-containing protein n=1 Tax=hydrothermal vent metagenome TaxID=652676 RepID=A0A3B1BVY8_9ZZZZ
MKIKVVLGVLSVSLFLFFCEGQSVPDKTETLPDNVIVPAQTINLWNGKDFSGWVKFIPDSSVNTDTVWNIVNGVINCNGKPSGYIRTKNDYANYKLSLEWRWVNIPGNSGVLLHLSLPDTVWPKSIEAQLLTGNAGDFYVIGGTEMAEHVNKDSRRITKQKDSSENPLGEWNKYEIICKDNTITLFVNGVLQNKATNISVNYGKIALQSEGKPIQFKNIKLEPVDK